MDNSDVNNKEKICVVADENNATNNTKETPSENLKGSKDEKTDKAKVTDVNENTEAPFRPTANNGAYSKHFNPIPAENKSDKNATVPLSTVDLSKLNLHHFNYSYIFFTYCCFS